MLAREIDERLNDHTGATPSPNLQADSTPYTDIEAELNLNRAVDGANQEASS
ncbi:MAG: hypothetical protein U0610_28950 [bacterium]